MQLLIVNFHYIREDKPKSGIYPITENSFKTQLEELAKYYTFISNSDLVEYISSDRLPEGNYCLITFDDGLKEQLVALDVLNKLSIPAVFYVTTQPLVDGLAHDVHKTHYVYSKFDDAEIFALLDDRNNIHSYDFDMSLLDAEYRYDSVIRKKIKYFLNFVLRGKERCETIDFMFSQLCANEEIFVKDLYMEEQDITALAKAGMLGTHTRSHVPLATLGADEISEDIASSCEILEKITGVRVDGVSYPYGGPAAVKKKVADIARAEGMKYGLSMIRGMNDDAAVHGAMMLYRVDTNDAPGGKYQLPQYIP